MRTFTYSELDALAQSNAVYYYQKERNSIYERNWGSTFNGWLFYADGIRYI